MRQLQSLIEDLRWLLVIGAVFVSLCILTFVVLTIVRLGIWRASVLSAAVRHRWRRYQSDGTPYPPAAAGICGRCGVVGRVFHLPDGRRLCRKCYRRP